jgi:hypothetical protein
MSSGDDQPLGGSDWSPRTIFDEPTVQVTLSQEPGPPPAGTPARGRILDDEPRSDPLGLFGSDPPGNRNNVNLDRLRAVPPFAAPGAPLPPDGPTVMERLMEGAYRWRSLLGLGLAGVMTMAIVVAYRGAAQDEPIEVASGNTNATGEAFRGTTTTGTPAESSIVTSSLVDSEVDEVSTTRAPAGPVKTSRTTQRAASTTASASTSSSADGSSASVSGSTSSSSSASTSSSTAITSPSTSPSSSASTAPSTVASTASTVATSASTSTTVRGKERLEAEVGTLLGQARVRTAEPGFSGTGYVTDLTAEDRGLSVATANAAGGTVPLRIRYAAGNEALPGTSRRLTLRVNGTDQLQLVMRETATWSDWTDLTGTVTLQPGQNTITLVVGRNDSGLVAIDYIELY